MAKEPWHAVSVESGPEGCPPATGLRMKRVLSSDAPRLPLADCVWPWKCRCTYRHYSDRRAGPRRASELGRPDLAFNFHSRAVAMWPAETDAADRLEQVARSTGRVAEVAEAYQRVIEEAYDAQTAQRYQTRRAMLLGEDLGRVDEAVEGLRAAIEIAPRDLAPRAIGLFFGGLLTPAGRKEHEKLFPR